MVLYAVTVSIMILLLISLKGPAELAILSRMGLDLVGGFKANLNSGGGGALAYGSVLVMILVVQPLGFGWLALKMIDKIHQLTVLAKVGAFGFLKLEQSGITRPKTKNDLLMQAHNGEPPMSVSLGSSNIAGAALQDILKLKPDDKRGVDIGIELVWFRGSKYHFMVIGLALLIYAVALIMWPPDVWPFACLALLCSIYGPTLMLYLEVLAEYSLASASVAAEERVTYSRYYDGYQQARHESLRPYISDRKRSLLKLRASLLLAVCHLNSWMALAFDHEKLKSYLSNSASRKEALSRLYLPGIAKNLELLAEMRGDQFSFRSNLFSYSIVRKFLGAQKVFNKTLIA